MATRKEMARGKDVACLRIGFEDYLLDADKAMQAMKLLREAIRCEKRFEGRRYRYMALSRPELEVTLVDPSHVLMPGQRPALESNID